MPFKLSKDLTMEYVVSCEDVREEIGNKFSLVGVINGDILTPVFPSVVKIAFFGSIVSKTGNPVELEMRILVNGKMVGSAQTKFAFNEGGKTANLVLPQGLLNLPEPSDINLDLKIPNGDWMTLVAKKILLNPATASEQPS